jgi:ligand-binding sensor domain-containing protein
VASVVGLLLLVGIALMLWMKSGQGDVSAKPLSPAAKPPVAAIAPSPAKPAAVPVAPVAAKPELPPGISGDPMEAFAWDGKLQGMHIMSMCQDTRGRLWVGTEGNGAWCWDPNVALKQLQAEQAWAIERKRLGTPESAASAKAKLYGWSQHTRVTTGGKPEEHGPVLTTGTSDVNSLGDDCVYAIACDKQGRIWTGHLNHGVSVYEGRSIPIKQPEEGYRGWHNYDVLSGPLGERVFDIGVNPVDGDVWIATDAGLSRYRVAADTWNYYTRADGLPADQVQALAFLKDGSVVAGTQCDGLGIAAPASKPQLTEDKAIPAGETKVAGTLEYPIWRYVTTENNSYDLPKTPIGVGLPSNLINDLLVTRDGTLWVATTTGIAKSTDGGKTWIFIRGEDWEAKLRGLAEPPTNDEINVAKQLVPARPQALLLEDYTTSISEDVAGNLWIGHWQRGVEIITQNGQQLYPVANNEKTPLSVRTSKNAYVKTIQANVLGRSVTGCYGQGLALEPKMPWQLIIKTIPKVDVACLSAIPPTPVSALSTGEIKTSLEKLSKVSDVVPAVPWGRYLGDDWMTQGDAIGHYGRKYIVFCGANSPRDLCSDYGADFYNITAGVGKHPNPKEQLRLWCWAWTSPERRVLYNTPTAVRTPSGWDDHAEVYSREVGGLGVWVSFTVPKGVFRLTPYFMNYDGHTATGSQRDYLLRLFYKTSKDELAHARVRDWYYGVYKSFLVAGPGTYRLHIDRNHSFNTMIMGAMIDRISGPNDYTDFPNTSAEGLMMNMGSVHYRPREIHEKEWNILNEDNVYSRLMLNNPTMPLQLLRYLEKNSPAQEPFKQKEDGIKKNIHWKYFIWDESDRCNFEDTMEKAWAAMQKQDPDLKTKKYRPYSPNTN